MITYLNQPIPAVDEAGPLWLALESVLESLPSWLWLAIGGCVVLAALIVLAVTIRRKS